MEDNKSLKLTFGNPSKKVPPVLGTPVHVDKGVYVVKNRAIIGKVYMVVCPKCQKKILVKATSAKTQRVACGECRTPIYYMGKEDTSGGTVRVLPPNGRIEWGSFFKKKSWTINYVGSFYIGRTDDQVKSDVSIDDEFVSRKSLLLEVLPVRGSRECKYKITVNKAANPVLVNGRSLELGESIYLNYGDTILVGNTTLTFKKDH